MQPALLIRLRPTGPWRSGPGDGALDRVDELYRSDRLFSAITIALQQLGFLDEWLDATVHANVAAVVFSSLYPFQNETLFAIPPASLWPPPAAQVVAPNSVFLAKIRWTSARFVPVSVIELLITGANLLAEQWLPDPESSCLLRRDRPSASPFRSVTRRTAAVDRLSRTSALANASACIEFEPGAGLWTIVRYRDPAAQSTWDSRIQAAFRLLADDGFGGRRSSGWGHAREPEFQTGAWPDLLLPRVARTNSNGASNGVSDETARYWMLSLYSPAANDGVDWRSGDYTLAVRGGRVESKRSSGISKKSVRMVAEGSVLVGPSEPAGSAIDVAPEGSDHPVFRSGLALALKLPELRPEAPEALVAESAPIEEPHTEDAVIEPCEPAVSPEPAQETEPVVPTVAPEEPPQQTSAPDEIVAEQPPEPIAHTDGEVSSAEPDPEKSPSDLKEPGDAL
jgi:CRISPR type III-A-associated RAMP protein Csm4